MTSKLKEERLEEGRKIDPATAEVKWTYAEIGDPYGDGIELPEDWQVGREYFARRPGSEVWVSFRDLPDATREALGEQDESELEFFPPF